MHKRQWPTFKLQIHVAYERGGYWVGGREVGVGVGWCYGGVVVVVVVVGRLGVRWGSPWKETSALHWRLKWRWRLKSPTSPLFTQPFIQGQINENTKAPRHWPLCGEFTEFPAQMASSVKNVSISWRHRMVINSFWRRSCWRSDKASATCFWISDVFRSCTNIPSPWPAVYTKTMPHVLFWSKLNALPSVHLQPAPCVSYQVWRRVNISTVIAMNSLYKISNDFTDTL